jgi:hypothetical protein
MCREILVCSAVVWVEVAGDFGRPLVVYNDREVESEVNR